MADEENHYIYLVIASTIGIILATIQSLKTTTIAGYILLVESLALLLISLKELLREKQLSIELLMGIVAIITLYYGYIVEGHIVLILYGFAETIEHLAVRRAKKSLEGLVKKLPSHILREENGSHVRIPIDEIRKGDTVIVSVGQMVPVDGVSLTTAAIDKSLITGEPYPEDVRPGAPIYSGSVVVRGPLKIRVLKVHKDSYIKRLVDLAEEALENKSKTQRLLERISPYLIASVLASYIVLAVIVDPIRALAVLLAGCPSAFIVTSGLSTALAVRKLASKGILVLDPIILETLKESNTVVVDKTGTLTRLKATLRSIKPPTGVGEHEFAGIIHYVLSQSTHPVAQAIVRALEQVYQGITYDRVSQGQVYEIVGKGMAARINGEELYTEPVNVCETKGIRIVYRDGEAVFCFEEELYEGAHDLLRYLKSNGKKVILASGDKRENVERIARILGIDEYYWDMKPEDKARLIDRLRADGRKVVFIGDGVNDTIAMSKSDASVAVGSLWAAIGVADAVINGGVSQLSLLFRVSQRYLEGLGGGFFIAGVVKVAVIGTGLMGLLSLPLMVLLGDDGSTLLSSLYSWIVIKYRD